MPSNMKRREPSYLHIPSSPVFCLECEECLIIDCDHHHHPRTVVENIKKHMKKTKHKKFQSFHNFLKTTKNYLFIENLAYNKIYGNKIRKKYKKMLLANLDIEFEMNSPKKCLKCNFETDQALTMFRHIRIEHLS